MDVYYLCSSVFVFLLKWKNKKTENSVKIYTTLMVRDQNNILFEIATDEPGFTITGLENNLGQSLHLPPKLASKREEIEALLKPIE